MESDFHGVGWTKGSTPKISSLPNAPWPLSVFMGRPVFRGFFIPHGGLGIITLLREGFSVW